MSIQFGQSVQPQFGMKWPWQKTPKQRVVLQESELPQLQGMLNDVCAKIRTGQYQLQASRGSSTLSGERSQQADIIPTSPQQSGIQKIHYEKSTRIFTAMGGDYHSTSYFLSIETDDKILTYRGSQSPSAELEKQMTDAINQQDKAQEAKRQAGRQQAEQARAQLANDALKDLKP